MTSSDATLWAMYVRLWGRAEGQGVYVHYVGFAPRGEAGYFDPRTAENGGPELALVRPHYPEPSNVPSPPADILAELITLAHEVGHLRSWRQGTRDEMYGDCVAAFNRGERLSFLKKEAIRDEERRAWFEAHYELSALGFSDWDSFVRRETDSMQAYDRAFEANE